MNLLFAFWQHTPFVLKSKCICSKNTQNVQQIVWDKFKVWLTVLTSLPSLFSETRLLEIVEAACEKTDFECNKLLEQIEDQVETWWFHRYVRPGNCKAALWGSKRRRTYGLCVMVVELVYSVGLTVAPCLLQAAGGPGPVWVAVHRGTEALLSTWPVWTWLQRCATADWRL